MSSDDWKISGGEIELGESAGRRHDGGCGRQPSSLRMTTLAAKDMMNKMKTMKRRKRSTLVAGLDASADDDDDENDQGVVQGERPPLIPRATRNADTPSANKVLARLGEEMRTRSEWMMMFAPVATAQAKWPVLGPDLTQPINSTGINQLVEDAVLLLKAMGYRCNSRPNSLILSGWSLARTSAELTQWKRRLRAEFGFEKAPGTRQTIMDRVAEFTQLGADPSRVPLPKTPETKRSAKGERFRSTVGTPYFEDAHMLTPKKGKPRGGRYDHLYDASDDAELGDSRDDSADPRGDRDETVKDQIRRLSYVEAERDNNQYLELRTHFSRDKVAEFEGKRYRSDAPVVEEVHLRDERHPHASNSWCEPFSLSLGRAAKSWYRQLPKKTQQRWSLLSEAPAEMTGANRRDDIRERRVTVADATVDDLYRGGEPRQLSRRSHSRDSSSSASAYGLSGDSGKGSDHSWSYVDAGAVSDPSAGNSNSATGRRDSRDNRPSRRDDRSERQRPDHRDRRDRQDDNRERRPYDRRERRGTRPSDPTMVLRLEKLTKFVRTSVDKSVVPADLHDIYEPRDLNPAEIEVSDVALAGDPEEDLRLRFVAAMAMCEDESITVVDNSATDPAEFECSANEIDLEDYAQELAFLPDLTASASTELDYGGSNVVCSAHTPSQREKLVKALKAQEGIMIASGNAVPPPAYGAICDIDVQGHKPIKQRARRVPLKHLKKLYEILKGLLKAGLIAFSNSP
ncbi:unnamed protein product [Phytophthora fragariaefolia]|uniref:Unnamed protein product n=1 Tax=Phytophthora fragariaefolia TaxID=1490495 RepID=A0A9W6Y7T7_9STRA|nr:unnamed protein product [Phytophthora fragariaefolia]